jgi:hypothetical protein
MRFHLLQTIVCTKLIMVVASPTPFSNREHAVCKHSMASWLSAYPSSRSIRRAAASSDGASEHTPVSALHWMCQYTKKKIDASCRMWSSVLASAA